MKWAIKILCYEEVALNARMKFISIKHYFKLQLHLSSSYLVQFDIRMTFACYTHLVSLSKWTHFLKSVALVCIEYLVEDVDCQKKLHNDNSSKHKVTFCPKNM